MVGLGTVMVPVGMSFGLLMCYNERILRLKVWWKLDSSAILDLFGSNQFMSCPWAVILLQVAPCPLLSCFTVLLG